MPRSEVSRLIPPSPAGRIFHVELAGWKMDCRTVIHRENTKSKQMGTHRGVTYGGGSKMGPRAQKPWSQNIAAPV